MRLGSFAAAMAVLCLALLISLPLSAEPLWACGMRYSNKPMLGGNCRPVLTTMQCGDDGSRHFTRSSFVMEGSTEGRCAKVAQPSSAPEGSSERSFELPSLGDIKNLFSPGLGRGGEKRPVRLAEEDHMADAECVIRAITGDKEASKRCGIPSFNDTVANLFPD